MHLESAYAGKRTRRGADFGGEVRQSGKIVAVESHRVGELASRDLHPIAGVAAKTNYGPVDNLTLSPRDVHCSSCHGYLNLQTFRRTGILSTNCLSLR